MILFLFNQVDTPCEYPLLPDFLLLPNQCIDPFDYHLVLHYRLRYLIIPLRIKYLIILSLFLLCHLDLRLDLLRGDPILLSLEHLFVLFELHIRLLVVLLDVFSLLSRRLQLVVQDLHQTLDRLLSHLNTHWDCRLLVVQLLDQLVLLK